MSKTVCKECYECTGQCWLNVAGTFDVWEIVSKKCKGTKEEIELLDNIFNKKVDGEILFSKYNFTEDEKKILKEFNYK